VVDQVEARHGATRRWFAGMVTGITQAPAGVAAPTPGLPDAAVNAVPDSSDADGRRVDADGGHPDGPDRYMVTLDAGGAAPARPRRALRRRGELQHRLIHPGTHVDTACAGRGGRVLPGTVCRGWA
jgi:hypothetical protein